MSGNESDVDVQGGGSAKGLLILGLLGGLLIGGGVAYYLMKDQIAAPEGQEEEVERRPEPAKELQAVRFERLTVPIYQRVGNNRRYIGNFFINIDVLVDGDDNLIAVRRSEPQLQHAFISAISSADLMQENSPQQLDMEKTSRLLMQRANAVLGSNIVENVSVIEAMRIPN